MGSFILMFVLLLLVLVALYFFRNKKTETKKYHTIDEAYNAKRNTEQAEIDKILDKINKRGIDSLSDDEKKKLDNFAKRQ